MDNAEIAKALFDAIARNDAASVRGLCADNMSVRQNNGPPMSLATMLNFSSAVYAVAKDFHYAEAVRAATVYGFVEEHAVRGVLPGGKGLDLTVCVVADVNDGKITQLREYFDSAAAADLITALS